MSNGQRCIAAGEVRIFCNRTIKNTQRFRQAAIGSQRPSIGFPAGSHATPFGFTCRRFSEFPPVGKHLDLKFGQFAAPSRFPEARRLPVFCRRIPPTSDGPSPRWINCARTRTRLAGALDRTFHDGIDGQALVQSAGTLLVVPLYCAWKCGNYLKRRYPGPNRVVSSSEIPFRKYSCAGSPEKFCMAEPRASGWIATRSCAHALPRSMLQSTRSFQPPRPAEAKPARPRPKGA